ncbi:MAG: molybdopterin-dependent oxidoreductase [Acidimicrobiia bacterium]|nr:molybdopterin-dependent oxidoreductase [Acidimicrobiia bacterium]
MPVTQWLSDAVPDRTGDLSVLRIAGADVCVDDLSSVGLEDVEAVLDCTSGWYAHQVWRGVRLDRVMDVGRAASIEVRSVTGYSRRFPASDASRLWLAVEVGGAPLSSGHGYPVRLVAPGRRGFWWVKWVAAVEPSDVPWWLQMPFPVR